MITSLSIIAIGFFLGIAHATDPDHLIAVTTIVRREGNLRRAALIGAAWGLGHTLTILLVGSAVLLVGLVIPGPVELSMELAVSLMLVLLGAITLRDFYRRCTFSRVSSSPPSLVRERVESGGKPPHSEVHSHYHAHGDYIHSHPHRHRQQDDGRAGHIHKHPHGPSPQAHGHRDDETPLARLDNRLGGIGPYRLLRPLVVGVVHGLAGSAAVALLILATIPDSNWGILYLLVFGLGTISGMTLFTFSIASASGFLQNRYPDFSQWMSLSSGLASLSFGVFMAWQLLA